MRTNKSHMVTFRCEDDLFQRMQELAATRKIPVSELIRQQMHEVVVVKSG